MKSAITIIVAVYLVVGLCCLLEQRTAEALSSIANDVGFGRRAKRLLFPRPTFGKKSKIWHPPNNNKDDGDDGIINDSSNTNNEGIISHNPYNHAIEYMPDISPATGLQNLIYEWSKYQLQIRYQVTGPTNGIPVILVHGLFVNSDHWRKTLQSFSSKEDNNNTMYRIYALDMLGMGYSSKPPINSIVSQAINGETKRRRRSDDSNMIMKNVELTTSCGTKRRIRDVDLRHPLNSPYNFYTWSDVLTDFAKDVVLRDQQDQSSSSQHNNKKKKTKKKKIALVSNSKGTVTCLQAVLDDVNNELFSGVFGISPNFRELHPAEMEIPQITYPILKTIQSILRRPSIGHQLYSQILKDPNTIKNILVSEPYQIKDAVDDTLVQVLRDPLVHTPYSASVVMDTLSYSGGPLIEQQLTSLMMRTTTKDSPQIDDDNKRRRQQQLPPIWFLYGKDDPWTPSGRMEALIERPPVHKVIGLDGVGHCPHDEAPDLVHPLLLDFLQQTTTTNEEEEEEEQQQQQRSITPRSPPPTTTATSAPVEEKECVQI